MKKLIALFLVLACVLSLIGCSEGEKKNEVATTDTVGDVVSAETELQIELIDMPLLDCKSLEVACADSFIDPSKVSVLGGEWAYSYEPNKFVALATVRYTNKDDEYEVAEIVMVVTFDGTTELFHHLNENSPYTRENALREFGAVDDQRFPLE